MAKLSAHGTEVGRIEFTKKVTSYHSDGQVLVNHGDGWKLYGKVKPDITPLQAYQHTKEIQDQHLRDNPHFKNWYKAITRYGLSKRVYIIMAIECMPDDPDGVWSELTDTYDYHAKMNWTIDEVVELCRLFKLAELETKERKGK